MSTSDISANLYGIIEVSAFLSIHQFLREKISRKASITMNRFIQFIKRENCLLLSALLLSFSSWGEAESIVLKDGKSLDSQDFNKMGDYATLQYGMVTTHYGPTLVEKVVLDKQVAKPIFLDPFLSSPVEASILPEHEVIRACIATHQKIQEARTLKDLKPLISNSAYQILQAKIKSGAQEINVVQLLKEFIPNSVAVTDTEFKGEKVKMAVIGKTAKKTYAGIIEMVREEATWKLDNEVWFGEDNKKPLVKYSVKPTNYINITEMYNADNLGEWYDPYFAKRKNPLHLRKAALTMPKESFFLFFFIDNNSKKLNTNPRDTTSIEELPQLHIAWSGNFKTLEQQRLQSRYPIDISVAQEKDGFLPGTMNLRLPKAKPKQFYVGVLMSF
jgi:hypothetical protein